MLIVCHFESWRDRGALCVVHETIRVKSAAWDDNSVLIYTTLNHIKYCLPNGDSGIIRTLEVPVYITRVSGSSLHCLDRDGKTRQIQVSPQCLMPRGSAAGFVYIKASHCGSTLRRKAPG